MLNIRYLYLVSLLLGLGLWLVFSFDYNLIRLFGDYWPSALTMLLGSFVAGSTPLGGGAVAFPIFTKVLAVDADQAKIFGLFIQSVGMTFATLLFISLKIKIYWRWLMCLLPTSILGMLVGLFYVSASSQEIRLLLSVFVVVSGILLVKTQSKSHQFQDPDSVSTWSLLVIGFPAGVLSSLVGTGADALLFFFVVLIFKQGIKSTIPTTVTYMAICSLIGSLIVLLMKPIPVSTFTFNSWLVAAPVVALVAPLGGFIMSKMNARYLLLFIKLIVLMEGLSTLILVELHSLEKLVLLILMLIAIIYLFVRWQRVNA